MDENAIESTDLEGAEQQGGVSEVHDFADKGEDVVAHMDKKDSSRVEAAPTSEYSPNSASEMSKRVVSVETAEQAGYETCPQVTAAEQDIQAQVVGPSQLIDPQPALSGVSPTISVRSLSSPQEVYPQDTDEGESEDSSHEDDSEPSRSPHVSPPYSLDSPSSPDRVGKVDEAQCTSPTVAVNSADAAQAKVSSSAAVVDSTPPNTGGNAQASKSDFETAVKKFGLSSQDKVLESFSCALYPKKGLLTHGRYTDQYL
ncbi:hypothetical protein EON64_01850 [archaeon]|nr:MAG: hypothetical protein EON64_01850 [archaeon]